MRSFISGIAHSESLALKYFVKLGQNYLQCWRINVKVFFVCVGCVGVYGVCGDVGVYGRVGVWVCGCLDVWMGVGVLPYRTYKSSRAIFHLLVSFKLKVIMITVATYLPYKIF